MVHSARTLVAKSTAIPTLMDQPGLVAVSIKGTESLNGLYCYKVILKTPDALIHFGSAANAGTRQGDSPSVHSAQPQPLRFNVHFPEIITQKATKD